MLDTTYSISIAKSNTKDSNDKTIFDVVSNVTVPIIGQLITERTWSPHIWRLGKRLSSKWEGAEFIALDFDSGFPLAETQKICENEGLTFLIGITKSHQVEKISPSGKISPAVDRYRLLIFTDGKIESAETYRNTLDYFSLFFPIDESCKDLARYFFPCQKIVCIGEGKLQPWLPVTDEQKEERAEIKRLHEEKIKRLYGTGLLPEWVIRKLRRSEFPIGTRHNTCYSIAAELTKLGFTESQIEKLLLNNNVLAEIGRDDVRRCVENAAGRIRKDWYLGEKR